MEIMDEYLGWFLSGELPPSSLIRDVQRDLDELGGAEPPEATSLSI